MAKPTVYGVGIGGLDRFDYMVHDIERALPFYRDILGLDVSSRGQTGAEFILPDGACFGLWSDPELPFQPSNGAMFHVGDLDRAVATLATLGIKPTSEVTTKVCRFATFLDPEGNTFALHRRHDA